MGSLYPSSFVYRIGKRPRTWITSSSSSLSFVPLSTYSTLLSSLPSPSSTRFYILSLPSSSSSGFSGRTVQSLPSIPNRSFLSSSPSKEKSRSSASSSSSSSAPSSSPRNREVYVDRFRHRMYFQPPNGAHIIDIDNPDTSIPPSSASTLTVHKLPSHSLEARVLRHLLSQRRGFGDGGGGDIESAVSTIENAVLDGSTVNSIIIHECMRRAAKHTDISYIKRLSLAADNCGAAVKDIRWLGWLIIGYGIHQDKQGVYNTWQRIENFPGPLTANIMAKVFQAYCLIEQYDQAFRLLDTCRNQGINVAQEILHPSFYSLWSNYPHHPTLPSLKDREIYLRNELEWYNNDGNNNNSSSSNSSANTDNNQDAGSSVVPSTAHRLRTLQSSLSRTQEYIRIIEQGKTKAVQITVQTLLYSVQHYNLLKSNVPVTIQEIDTLLQWLQGKGLESPSTIAPPSPSDHDENIPYYSLNSLSPTKRQLQGWLVYALSSQSIAAYGTMDRLGCIMDDILDRFYALPVLAGQTSMIDKNSTNMTDNRKDSNGNASPTTDAKTEPSPSFRLASINNVSPTAPLLTIAEVASGLLSIPSNSALSTSSSSSSSASLSAASSSSSNYTRKDTYHRLWDYCPTEIIDPLFISLLASLPNTSSTTHSTPPPSTTTTTINASRSLAKVNNNNDDDTTIDVEIIDTIATTPSTASSSSTSPHASTTTIAQRLAYYRAQARSRIYSSHHKYCGYGIHDGYTFQQYWVPDTTLSMEQLLNRYLALLAGIYSRLWEMDQLTRTKYGGSSKSDDSETTIPKSVTGYYLTTQRYERCIELFIHCERPIMAFQCLLAALTNGIPITIKKSLLLRLLDTFTNRCCRSLPVITHPSLLVSSSSINTINKGLPLTSHTLVWSQVRQILNNVMDNDIKQKLDEIEIVLANVKNSE